MRKSRILDFLDSFDSLLLLQFVLLHHILVLLRLIHLEVVEKRAAFGDFAKEPAASGVILLVLFEVLGEEIDLLREDRDLHMGRTGVFGVGAVLANQLLLIGAFEHGDNGKETYGHSVHAAPPEAVTAPRSATCVSIRRTSPVTSKMNLSIDNGVDIRTPFHLG